DLPDLLLCLLQRGLGAAHDHHCCPIARQPRGRSSADAATAARDQRRLTRERFRCVRHVDLPHSRPTLCRSSSGCLGSRTEASRGCFVKFSMIFEAQTEYGTPDAERRTIKDCLEQAVFAEQMGFDGIWAVEHHALVEYSHMSAPEVF